jgi:hypothetical protein
MRYYRTSGILHKNRAFEEQESSLWIMRPKETTSPKDKAEKERINQTFSQILGTKMWIVTNKTGSHYP